MMTNSYLPRIGGVANSVKAFTEQYRQQGHRTLVVAPDYDGKEEQDEDVIRLPSIQHCSGIDYSLRLPVPGYLENQLSGFEPDIIHSHHPFFVGSTAQRFSARHHLPLIFTHHTRYELYTHYTPVKSLNMKNFIVSLSSGYENLCDLVIAPSNSIRDILRTREVKTPIAVIPTGVDFERFHRKPSLDFRKKHAIPDQTFLAGYIGRITQEKNLLFMAKAALQFLEENHDSWFLFTGDGPTKQELESLFRNKGMQKRVVFTGSLTGDELVSAYHSLDVFVFTSKSETQGMVLTEAMASSTPVVSLKATGTTDVIRDGQNGYLVEKEEIQEVNNALVRIKELAPGDRKTMQENARQTAQNFSIKNCAKKMLAVYENAVEEYEETQQDEGNLWIMALEQAKTEVSMFKNAMHAFDQALAGK